MRRSLRWRLLAWFALLLAVLLGGFGVTAFKMMRRQQQESADETLSHRLVALVEDRRGPIQIRTHFAPPGPPPDHLFEGSGPDAGQPRPPSPPPQGDRPPDGFLFNERAPNPRVGRTQLSPTEEARASSFTPSPATIALLDNTPADAAYYALWSRDGSHVASTRAPADLPKPPMSDANARIHFRTRGTLREAYFFTELGDCVLTGASNQELVAAARTTALWFTAAGGLIFLVGVGGGWILVTRSIRPIGQISAAAGRIASGNLDERIDVKETDGELGRLAAVLNDTFARLDAAFAQQRRFTADASHEMRTPLAVIVSETQNALARERSSEEYRETIAVCLSTAQRLSHLSESLLQLARFDAGQEPPDRSPTDLAEIAQSTAELLTAIGRPRDIVIETSLQPARLIADANQLHQVARNLVDNAIYYNKDGGRVTIRTWTETDRALLSVTDTGCGFSDEEASHLFERFYRADRSRSRAGQRSGLGLAICEAIVHAHRGSITAQGVPGRGATFTVSLPAVG